MPQGPSPSASVPERPPTILFVCLGNICRSPMAAGLLKRRLAERGLSARYNIRSAGIIAWDGGISPLDALEAAAEQGVDLSTHLATPLTRELIKEAALVVAMDRANVEHILNLVPDLGPRLRLLNQFAADAPGFDVPDPMGCPIEVFRESYRLIQAGIEGLVEALARGPVEAPSGSQVLRTG